ncbi:nucleotidyltransferase domain-containing protein [Candidatus Micrarchaeota archaeon]|nr:nucleotidyltransferase domain-containing protein [Candidatus Micrarchaeota archaeon]
MLSSFISSEVKRKLLQYFILKNKEGTVRGIAEELQANPSQVSRELKKLEETSLLIMEKRGNQKNYSLNLDCNFVDDLRGFLLKTSTFQDILKNQLKNIKNIKCAFIFGSYAQNNFNSNSDIDLFIIGEPDVHNLNKVIHKIEKKIGWEINYVVMPKEEFNSKKQHGFIKNILQNEKIPIKGDINEFI